MRESLDLSIGVRGFGLEADGRGLMKLDVARKIVRGAAEFRKDDGRMINGTNVLESDVLWAALMSLEDAEEFVREGKRIRWTFHPRKSGQREPVARYGEGILPWLASFVRDGVLVNVPWCILECLNELGSAEAFSLLMGLKEIVQFEGEPGQPGPFAHGFPFRFDVDAALEEVEVPAEASRAVVQAVMDFAWENPHGTWARLTTMSCNTDIQKANPLAIRVLTQGAFERPSEVFAHAVESSKDEAFIRKIFEQMGLPSALAPEMILGMLDRACQDAEAWPNFYGIAPERAYHALRLVAARQKEGDTWFVLFECLEGSELDGAPGQGLYIRRYIVKSDGSFGLLRGVGFPGLKVESEGPAGVTFAGPLGRVTVNPQGAQKYLPLRATAADALEMKDTIGVRAYIAECGLPFPKIPDLFEAIGLLDEQENYDVFVSSTAFEHVIGTAGAEYDPQGIDAKWRLLPSDSMVFQSLAVAVAERDATKFKPGTSNLDWRLHVDAEKPSRVGISFSAPTAETFAAAQAAMSDVAAGAGDPDPVVFPGKKLAKLSDYVGFMKRMQAGDMMGAMAAYGLDMMAFGAVAQEWAAKMGSDPTLAAKMTALMSK